MADIGMLYGDMYLRNAWRIILQNDININAELEAIKDRITGYIYHINPLQFSISSAPTSIIKFNPEVITSTHVIIGLSLNINTAVATNISLNIKYDGIVVSTQTQTLVVGYNIIAFPYFLPSVGTGIHQVEIIAYTSSGTVIVEPNKFNIHLQAQSIVGSSSLPPSINVYEEIMNHLINNDLVTSSIQISILNDVGANITQSIGSLQINNNKVSTTVLIQLL